MLYRVPPPITEVVLMSMADEFAAIAKAAFLAGALSETKKQATKAGKSTVKTGAKLAKKAPKKASAYAKRYGKAFKRLL